MVPSLDTVRRLVIEGQVSGDHELARAGDGPWQRLGDIEQLKAYVRMAKSGGQRFSESEEGQIAESLASAVDIECQPDAPSVVETVSEKTETSSETIPTEKADPSSETPVEEASEDDAADPNQPPKREDAAPNIQPASAVQKEKSGSPIAALSILAAFGAIVVFLLFFFDVI